MKKPSADTLQRIKNLSNKDLYDILEFPEDYKPHLWEFAEAELERRNLSKDELENLRLCASARELNNIRFLEEEDSCYLLLLQLH